MSEAHAPRKPLKATPKRPLSTSPLRITSYAAKEAAVDRISEFEEDGQWWVHFRKSGEDRSQKQRRLMAMWAREWVDWLRTYKGDAFNHVTADDAYNSFKWRFVLPRLIEVDTFGVWQLCEKRIISLNDEGAKLKFAGEYIHSNSLSTDEYCKAMEEWEAWTRNELQSDGHFQPSYPDDLYYSAMGKR